MATRYALLLFAALLTACNERPVEQPRLTYAEYAERLAAAGIDATLLGRSWLEAGRAALRTPTPVTLPYAETGAFLAHEATAHGYSFAGAAGQTALVEIDHGGAVDDALDSRVFVELFALETSNDRTRYTRLAGLTANESLLEIELPEDGSYIVRVQPELLADAHYRLTIELEAVLPFPVSGLGTDAVQSFFGAERDAGARHHEGVDIFAPRSTPVLAVADGHAAPRRNRLGGNTVWLTVPGAAYYYAHLERPAFEHPRRVRAGDVIGYVGNSGNAATTAPHLHFGAYRWGRGPIDPLPLLGARHFDDELAPASFMPQYGVTSASALNLRSSPSRSSPSIDRLPGGTIVHATAASGDWLRVRLPGRPRDRGWIHSRYQRGFDAARATWRVPDSLFLHDAPAPGAVAVEFVADGTALDVLAEQNGYRLVRSSVTGRVGWADSTAGSGAAETDLELARRDEVG